MAFQNQHMLSKGGMGAGRHAEVHQGRLDFARGEVGYAEVTSSQGGIGAETDLTGLSVTVNNPRAGRRLQVTVSVEVRCSNAGERLALRIKEDGSTVQQASFYSAVGSTSLGQREDAIVRLVPSAGDHTYKATLERTVGTGTAGTVAASTIVAFILVEDLGPA